MCEARRRKQAEWVGVFVFVICYVMSIIIDSTFDVALEGPMEGIWFWCLIGFGIGSVTVYRYSIERYRAQPRRIVQGSGQRPRP
jgi:hypothetical protein